MLRARELLCAGLLAACGPRHAEFATTTRFADVPRRAPGVAIDPSTRLPDPAREARTRDGMVVLRTPLPVEAAVSVVRAFFRAVVAEMPDDLTPLLGDQAVASIAGGRQPAGAFWRSRLLQLDYTQLTGQLLFLDADIETYRAADLALLPEDRRIPLDLREDELALRVPIRISWAGRTRLFGDVLVFRMRPVGRHYVIGEIAEDFRMP